jgi:hypothetical protein
MRDEVVAKAARELAGFMMESSAMPEQERRRRFRAILAPLTDAEKQAASARAKAAIDDFSAGVRELTAFVQRCRTIAEPSPSAAVH